MLCVIFSPIVVNFLEKHEQHDKVVTDIPLEENVNVRTMDGEEARNVDEAISVLRY